MVRYKKAKDILRYRFRPKAPELMIDDFRFVISD